MFRTKTKCFPLIRNTTPGIITVILLIHLLFLTPFLHVGVPNTHDGENHIARLAAYVKAFNDGHFPPRWAGDLNYGYGTPVFNFFYPLPGYIGSIFHSFRLSYEISFKCVLALAFLLGPIGMYAFLNKYYSVKTSFLGSIIFGLLPYRFLNLYVRGDVGELLATSLAPWILYLINLNNQKPSVKAIVIGGFLWGCMILSHNAASLIFLPIFLGYLVIKSSWNCKTVRNSLFILLYGFLISFYFWFPAIMEQKYTNAKFFAGSFFMENFLPLNKLVHSSWNFGDSIGSQNSLSPELGLIPFILVCISIFWIIYSKKITILIIYWIMILIISIILLNQVSTAIWVSIPFLKLFQFPWRFMMVTSFAAVIIITPFLQHISSKYFINAIFIIILVTSIRTLNTHGHTNHSDSWYETFNGTTYYHGEASTIWTAGDPFEKPKEQISFIKGNGNMIAMKRNTIIHEYIIYAENSATLLDNTLYYPGWNVYVDGKKTPIEFQNPEHRGLITFEIPKGESNIVVKFDETKIRSFANVISLISIEAGILALIANQTQRLHKQLNILLITA